jgi:Tfp pilus assembly protein PilW
MKPKGFTLVELLLYVSIGALVISGFIAFGWNFLYTRVRARTQQELNQNMRLAAERISFEIRNATSSSSIGSSSITLLASDSAHSPVVIDLSDSRIRIGAGTSGACTSSSPCALTDNLVNVTNLSFTNLSSASASTNIRFSFTISSNTGRVEYQYDQTYTGSAELRSNVNYVEP